MRKTNAVRRNCLRVETTPKQRFIDMACNCKSHAIKLWRVISVKFNIGKKIIRLEKMTLNLEKI